MKIFIADHSEVFRLGLTRLLESLYSDIKIWGDESVKVMLNHADWKQTDLVILQPSNDIEQDEIDLTTRGNLFESGLKILVLSDQPDFSQVRYLFSLGIKGYADRASSIASISEAIQSVLADKVYVEPSLLIQYFDHQTKPKKSPKVNSERPLTDKELEIATYLVKGFKTNEISRLLSKKATTISTQKANIYQKLGVSNVVELLDYMDRSLKNGNFILQNKY